MNGWSVRAAAGALALLVTTAAYAGAEQADRLLSAQIRLSNSLVERLQTTPGATAVVSPAGVAAALALLDLGTDETFRKASQRVLGFDAKVDAAADFANLRQEISSLDRAGSDGATFTFANAAVFDPKHGFAGCIPGIHEVLRRQGLLEGTWCLHPDEVLSPGQSAELDRVMRSYPELVDDR